MAFKCPFSPRDSSTCTNCPIFNECLIQNTGSDNIQEEDDNEHEYFDDKD